MRFIVLSFLMTLIFQKGLTQNPQLKSFIYGYNLIYGENVSKDSLIDYVRFIHGINNEVNIVRIDNVGYTLGGDGPLVISTEEPILVDSLGLIPLKIDSKALQELCQLTQELDTKIQKNPKAKTKFRITYRYNGMVQLYFFSGEVESSKLLSKIEKCILKMSNNDAKNKFYQLVYTSGLLERTASGLRWKYLD